MLGASLMIVAMFLIPVSDAAGKYVAGVAPYGPATMAWLRFAVGAIIMAPVALFWVRETRFDRFFVISQILRGLLACGTITFILVAVTRIPMADAFGAFFIGPAVSTIVARFVVHEPVTRLEWGALVLGLAGVWLVTRPGASMESGTLYALAAGVCYGCFLTATRWSSGRVPPVMALVSQLIIGSALLAPIGLPEMFQFGLPAPEYIVLLAIPSLAANLLTIVAYRFARAGAMAPLVYLQIVSATLIGYVVFDDLPDRLAAIGLSLILGAGILLLWRSRRLA